MINQKLILSILFFLALAFGSNPSAEQRYLETTKITVSPKTATFLAQSYIILDNVRSPTLVTKVELIQDAHIFDLKIIRAYSTGQIKCLCEKGLQGVHKFRIWINNQSIDIQETIEFLVNIYSISPKSGNYKGGVQLTIIGENFSLFTDDNLVRVGNVNCDVLSANEKELICILGAAQESLVGSSARVTIYSKEGLMSTDKNSSEAKYQFIRIDQQPTISKILSNGIQYYMGEQVTIKGMNICAIDENTLVKVGSQFLTFSCNEDTIKFIVPYDISTDNSQTLQIFVGSQGNTEQVPFPIAKRIQNFRCLSPSGELYISNGSDSFFSLEISGKEIGSDIIFSVNQYQYSSFYVLSTFGYQSLLVKFYFQQYNSVNIHLTSIQVDGVNVLDSIIPIKIIERHYSYKLKFALEYDSTDITYFIIQFQKHEISPALEVFDVYLKQNSDEQEYIFMEKINSLTFRAKRYLHKTLFQISVCSNFGTFDFYQQYYEKAIYSDMMIQKLTEQTEYEAGDSIYFKITSSETSILNLQEIFMLVQCGKSEVLINSQNERQIFLNEKIYHFVQPSSFEKNTGIFNFQFPVILPLGQSYINQCDISIQYAKANNILKIQNNFKFYFNFNIEYFSLDNLISYQHLYHPWYYQQLSSLQQQFLDAVTLVQIDILVLSFSPQYISSYGGQLLTINGHNLHYKDQTTTVMLQGIACEIQSISNTQITCITGVKEQYNILEFLPTYVAIGKAHAFYIQDIKYVFDLSDQIQFRYLDNELTKYGKLYVPSQYGVIVDLSKIFSDTIINLDRITVDGYLEIRSSQDREVTINRINGKGRLSFGTQISPITSNLRITIQLVEYEVKISSYGKNKAVHAYKVDQSANFGSSIITTTSIDTSSIAPLTNMQLFSLSLDDNDEEFTVEKSSSSDISFTSKVQKQRNNILETYTLSDQQTQITFNVKHHLVEISRNLVIITKQFEQFTILEVKGTQLILPNLMSVIIDLIEKSNLQTSASYLYLKQVKQSIIKLTIPIYAYSNIITDSYIYTQSKQRLQLACSVFTNNFVSNLSLEISQQITNFSNNIIVRALTCLHFQLYSTIEPVIAGQNNFCVSVQRLGGILPFQSLQIKTNTFVYAIDVRDSIIASIIYSNFQFKEKSSQNKDSLYIVIINSLRNNNLNKPCIAHFTKNDYRYPLLLSNMEVLGLDASVNLFIKDYSEVNSLELSKFRTDINQQSNWFKSSLTQLMVFDRDGTFSGSVQNVVSSDLVHSAFGCSKNSLQQNVCNAPFSFIYTKLNEQYPTWIIFPKSQNYFKSIINEVDLQTKVGLGVTDSISSLRVVSKIEGSSDQTPIYIELFMENTFNSEMATIINYSYNIIEYQIQLTLNFRIVDASTVKQLSASSCYHGQYIMTDSGLNVCLNQINIPIILIFTPQSFPFVNPIINQFIVQENKLFHESADFLLGSTSYKQLNRWIIHQNWNMVLSQGIEYDIPSLIIYGTLTIDLGTDSAIIKTKGICVAGGRIIYLSGNITFQLIKDNTNEDIFKYIFQNLQYKAGTFLIHSQVMTKTLNSPYPLNNARVLSVDSSNNKIIVLQSDITSPPLIVGDEVVITAPTNSYILKTIVKSVTPIGNQNRDFQIVLEDAFQYTGEFIKTVFLHSEQDFRPILAKVSRPITIKNAQILIISQFDNYQTDVDFTGVAFIDTQIELSRRFNKLNFDNCIFSSSLGWTKEAAYASYPNHTPLNFYIYLNKPVAQINNSLISQNSNLIITNSVFGYSNQHVIVDRFYKDYISSFINYNYFSWAIYYLDTKNEEQELFYPIQISKNLFLNAQENSINVDVKTNLSNNIIIGSKKACIQSKVLCPITNYDFLIDCGNFGVLSNCKNYSKLVVARSNQFSSAPFGTYSEIISIENLIHFNFNTNYLEPTNLQSFSLVIKSSDIVLNHFNKNQNCVAQNIVSVNSMIDSSMNIIQKVQILQSNVYDAKCKQNVMVKVDSKPDPFPIITFTDTNCINCSLQEVDFISHSWTSPLPSTFKAQDTTGSFFNNPNPIQFTSKDISPYYQISSIDKIYSLLTIKQLNVLPNQTIKTYSVTSYTTNEIDTILAINLTAHIFVQSGIQYKIEGDVPLTNIKAYYSSLKSSEAEYIVIRLIPRNGYQLVLKDKNSEIIMPTQTRVENSPDSLNQFISEQKSVFKCGMNIQDLNSRENLIILTDDCLISIIETPSIIIKFKIATIILPEPTPSEEGMCDADRRVIYLIYQISKLLKISTSRVRVLGRSESRCNGSRLLEETTPAIIEYIIAVDPKLFEQQTDLIECTSLFCKNGRLAEEKVSFQSLVTVSQNINNLKSSDAITSGLLISDLNTTIPSIISSGSQCTGGMFQQNEVCVGSCSDGFFQQGSLCLACSKECNKCFGSTKFDCLSCSNSYTLVEEYNSNKYCSKSNSSCTDNCRICGNTCVQCQSSFVLHNELCISVCPTGKYNDNGICKQCPDNCESCLSFNECATCKSGKLGSNSLCLAQTQENPFIEEISQSSSITISQIVILITLIISVL